MVDSALTHIVADYQSRPVLAINHHQEVTGVGEYDAFGFRNRGGMAAAAVAKSQDVTGLGKLPVGGLDSDFRLRVGFIEAPGGFPGYVEVKDSVGTVLSTAVGQYPSIVSAWHTGAGFTASFNTGASSAPMHAVLQGFEYDRRNSNAKYFPPMRFPGQYFDEETDLHENWNRFYDPATGSYTTTEPLLQSPTYLRAMAQGGVSVPPYAYAGSNPLRYLDATGAFIELDPAIDRYSALDVELQLADITSTNGKASRGVKQLRRDRKKGVTIRTKPDNWTFGAGGTTSHPRRDASGRLSCEVNYSAAGHYQSLRARGSNADVYALSPAALLAHELGHAYGELYGSEKGDSQEAVDWETEMRPGQWNRETHTTPWPVE